MDADQLRASLVVAKGHGIPGNANGSQPFKGCLMLATWHFTCPYQVLDFVASLLRPPAPMFLVLQGT